MAQVEVSGLTVRYGTVTALEGLDLQIGTGEIFVLLGGSGSGKTTLLRALGGFIPPSAGRIVLAGQDITRLPPHRRPVNTTFQSYALFPHMSVAENIGFGLRRQGVARTQIASRVGELLDLVRLREFATRRPDALSGGQRQRVALARALAPRPRLLLLDEPMSALDRGLREQTRQELLRVQRQTGTTFVLVTHDQDEALAMATRIGLLHEGRLAQVGTPAELYEQPASRYVAGFMGNDNVLPARVREPGPPALLELDGIGLAEAAGAASASGPLWVALRPERLRIERGGTAGVNRACGTIAESAYFGDSADYTVRLPGGAALQVTQPLGRGIGAGLLVPGTDVTVSWTADACVLLTA
ncbi:MAG: ABC transporter ATP-binding protein [Acetobacteraceae bacterium]